MTDKTWTVVPLSRDFEGDELKGDDYQETGVLANLKTGVHQMHVDVVRDQMKLNIGADVMNPLYEMDFATLYPAIMSDLRMTGNRSIGKTKVCEYLEGRVITLCPTLGSSSEGLDGLSVDRTSSKNPSSFWLNRKKTPKHKCT